MLAKKHLEINPNHPIMKELLERIKSSGGNPDKDTIAIMDLLFDTALLNSGFVVEDPTTLNA
jgi:molecular chaperone HtpG